MTRTQMRIEGREFTVYDHGRSDGPAIVYHHGTPNSGEPLQHLLDEIEAHGARWVSYDRPGYGDSAPHPGRSVADAAADCAAILDAMGIEQFATWGISGGGPHALACGALLPERCTATASLAGVAPFEAPKLNYFAGMGRDNWVEVGLSLAGREHLEPHLRSAAEQMLAAGPEQLSELLSSLVVGPDSGVLQGPIGEGWAAAMSQAFKHGVQGWLDDDLAFVEPFGFELSAIRVPMLIVHGRQDSFVPVAHGDWLAQALPDAEAWILEDEAHLSLLASRAGDVFAWLLAQS